MESELLITLVNGAVNAITTRLQSKSYNAYFEYCRTKLVGFFVRTVLYTKIDPDLVRATLKELGDAILENFCTDQLVTELTEISK